MVTGLIITTFRRGESEAANREAEIWLASFLEVSMPFWLRPQPLLFMSDFKAAEKSLRENLGEYPEEPLFISMDGIHHALEGEHEGAFECAPKGLRVLTFVWSYTPHAVPSSVYLRD